MLRVLCCFLIGQHSYYQQEIEEDKKKAEQEGIAITTPRKPRAHEQSEPDRKQMEKENFTITVDLSKSPAAGVSWNLKLGMSFPRNVSRHLLIIPCVIHSKWLSRQMLEISWAGYC